MALRDFDCLVVAGFNDAAVAPLSLLCTLRGRSPSTTRTSLSFNASQNSWSTDNSGCSKRNSFSRTKNSCSECYLKAQLFLGFFIIAPMRGDHAPVGWTVPAHLACLRTANSALTGNTRYRCDSASSIEATWRTVKGQRGVVPQTHSVSGGQCARIL